jgi:hypothetical protein
VVYRVFFFLVGFGLMVIGFMYIIMYTNLMTIGYSFSEYLYFISGQIECLLALIGLVIISLTIFVKGGLNNELYL